MGRHIKRVIEFDNKEKVDNIIAKFKRSGYISKSDQKILDKIGYASTSIDSISDDLDKIIPFFDKYDEMEWENILMEFFDGTSYNFSAQCYIILKELASYNSNINNIILDNNYRANLNKKEYLLSEILKIMNQTKYKRLSIYPRVTININHREYFFDYNNGGYQYPTEGMTYIGLTTLNENIKKRSSLFMKCISDISISSRSTNWSPINYSEDNNMDRIRKRILLNDFLNIDFKLI